MLRNNNLPIINNVEMYATVKLPTFWNSVEPLLLKNGRKIGIFCLRLSQNSFFAISNVISLLKI